jgi:hypothetical protein
MRTKQKSLTGILITLLVLIAFAISSRALLRPPMPETWHSLHIGMTAEEVLKAIPDEHIDLRSLKGFETFTQKTTMLGGEAHWQLLVSYDASGKLTNARAIFTHQNCGWFNTSPRDILTKVSKQ